MILNTYTSPDGRITLINADCMEVMAGMSINEYSLALVDVPYGIGEDGSKNHTRSKKAKAKNYKPYAGNDITAPEKIYFDKLIEISKNQIIWGANHFISKMPYDSSCWIVWDKNNGDNDFADCELAWTSFKTAVRKFKWTWNGMLQENMKKKQIRHHPNEKPIELYSWILKNYAEPNDTILDTHAGSMSIAIAVHKANTLDNMNLKLTCIELDTEYYEKAVERFKKFIAQQTIEF